MKRKLILKCPRVICPIWCQSVPIEGQICHVWGEGEAVRSCVRSLTTAEPRRTDVFATKTDKMELIKLHLGAIVTFLFFNLPLKFHFHLINCGNKKKEFTFLSLDSRFLRWAGTTFPWCLDWPELDQISKWDKSGFFFFFF